jgi:hypothetical protein
MSSPEIDRATAESMEEDADFAAEHKRPTYADEESPEGAEEESVPPDDGGLAVDERRRPE